MGKVRKPSVSVGKICRTVMGADSSSQLDRYGLHINRSPFTLKELVITAINVGHLLPNNEKTARNTTSVAFPRLLYVDVSVRLTMKLHAVS
jgi:hypothetical protein